MAEISLERPAPASLPPLSVSPPLGSDLLSGVWPNLLKGAKEVPVNCHEYSAEKNHSDDK